jgi:plastocyanin
MDARERSTRRGGKVLLMVLVAGLALVGCGSDKPTRAPATQAPTTAARTTVGVTLREYGIIPAQASAPAGQVTFEAKNIGPKAPHELVVLKTDLDSGALPTTPEGKAAEEGAGIQAVGEIGEFKVGQTRTKTFALQPGSYVLICNVVEKEAGKPVAHYKLGMRAPFTVQ